MLVTGKVWVCGSSMLLRGALVSSQHPDTGFPCSVYGISEGWAQLSLCIQDLWDDCGGAIYIKRAPPIPKIYLNHAWVSQNPLSGLQDVADLYLSHVQDGFILGQSERKSHCGGDGTFCCCCWIDVKKKNTWPFARVWTLSIRLWKMDGGSGRRWRGSEVLWCKSWLRGVTVAQWRYPAAWSMAVTSPEGFPSEYADVRTIILPIVFTNTAHVPARWNKSWSCPFQKAFRVQPGCLHPAWFCSAESLQTARLLFPFRFPFLLLPSHHNRCCPDPSFPHTELISVYGAAGSSSTWALSND